MGAAQRRRRESAQARGFSPIPLGRGNDLSARAPAPGERGGGREGNASGECCTHGPARHVTSAKAGSAAAQVRKQARPGRLGASR